MTAMLALVSRRAMRVERSGVHLKDIHDRGLMYQVSIIHVRERERGGIEVMDGRAIHKGSGTLGNDLV